MDHKALNGCYEIEYADFILVHHFLIYDFLLFPWLFHLLFVSVVDLNGNKSVSVSDLEPVIPVTVRTFKDLEYWSKEFFDPLILRIGLPISSPVVFISCLK